MARNASVRTGAKLPAVNDDWRSVRAPGRVNLIGDHTDYQDGLCLPMAIDREVRLAFGPRDDARVVVTSDAPGVRLDAMTDAARAVLEERGRTPIGLDGTITSTVPIGAGLSSSAAVEVALCLALCDVARWPLVANDLALAAQEVEHRATGVPCGVMDQMASVHGRAGHALLLDCRDLTVEPVPLPETVDVVVVHSGLTRALAGSEYAQRRAACEAAAERLGVPTLRDATRDQVADDPIARHVVSENERVRQFAEALRRNDVDALGRLMCESHRSLRDDYRVSTPELDLLVDLLVQHGAYGARLTGAGFGGCVVALFAGGTHAEAAADQYRAGTGLPATTYVVRAVDGAGPVPDT
jgi:galactokinase